MPHIQEWQSLQNLFLHQNWLCHHLSMRIASHLETEAPLPAEIDTVADIIKDTSELLKRASDILEKWAPGSPSEMRFMQHKLGYAIAVFGRSVKMIDPRASIAFKAAKDIVNSSQQSLILALGLYQCGETKSQARDTRSNQGEREVARVRPRRSSTPKGGPRSSERDQSTYIFVRPGRTTANERKEIPHGVQNQRARNLDLKSKNVSAAECSSSERDIHFIAEIGLGGGKVGTKAKAILDHESDVEMVSRKFLSEILGSQGIEEVLKLRLERGRRGVLVSSKERIELTWHPLGSKKSMTTYFLVDGKDDSDFDILLGRSWVDLSGIFTDIEMGTLKAVLPGVSLWRSSSQRERDRIAAEESRRTNEELVRRQQEIDRLQRELHILSGSLPSSSGNTGSVTSSGQTNVSPGQA